MLSETDLWNVLLPCKMDIWKLVKDVPDEIRREADGRRPSLGRRLGRPLAGS